MEKIDARSISTDAQQQLRDQAICFPEDVGPMTKLRWFWVFIHRRYTGWWQACQKQGLTGIEIKKRGCSLGLGRRLIAKQADQLRRLLIDKTPGCPLPY